MGGPRLQEATPRGRGEGGTSFRRVSFPPPPEEPSRGSRPERGEPDALHPEVRPVPPRPRAGPGWAPSLPGWCPAPSRPVTPRTAPQVAWRTRRRDLTAPHYT